MSAFSRIASASVQRISIPWVIDVVQAIDGLDSLVAGQSLASQLWRITNASYNLSALFEQSVYRPYLRISREKATTLQTNLTGLMATANAAVDNDKQLEDGTVWYVKYLKDQFKPVFISEISTLPAFLVMPKEGYDVAHLIENGIVLFPSSLGIKAPEAILDAMEAGKALAYELSTACGFHTFRVLESVLKRYWDSASRSTARPTLETIGNYADCLERGGFGEKKIWETLKQIAKLHRNPLIHPEVILDVGEAIETLGIVRSATGAMLRTTPDVPATTGVLRVSGP